jgi:hypothetical protein
LGTNTESRRRVRIISFFDERGDPMSRTIKRAAISLFLVLASCVPGAQGQQPTGSESQGPSAPVLVPRLVKFSGTLLDEHGRPQEGPVGVTFALYAEQTGGAALWLETQNVKADASGAYTVLLGANSTNGVPAELFVSGEARWLGIQVEHQPEHDRILLVSVPYALKAGDAETLGGLPASAFVTTGMLATPSGGAAPANASVPGAPPKSGTGVVPEKAPVTSQVACASVTSDGTATANSIALFTTGCNVQSSLMTQTLVNGFPGVNVAGNNAGLLLSGTGTHQVQVTGATSGRLGQDAGGFFFASDSNGSNVRFLTNNGSLNEWMRITSSGNVGIGTTSPAQKLSVAGTVQSITGGFMFPDSTVQTSASLGSVTSVASGLGLTGGPITGSGTLAINPAVVPQLTASSNTFTGSISASSFNGGGAALTNVNAAMLGGNPPSAFATTSTNSFTGNQSIMGNLTLTGSINSALVLQPSVTNPSSGSTSANVIEGYMGTIGGNSVTAGVTGATISGGGGTNPPSGNLVTDDGGTVGGGAGNQAGNNSGSTYDAPYSTVGGGFNNTASGPVSTVGGGNLNTANGPAATVAGGGNNAAIGGGSATVGGGRLNTASGGSATISGGDTNTASGNGATVPGGGSNVAAGALSFAAGFHAKANHDGAFVWGDYNFLDVASTANNQFIARATGGVTFISAIDGTTGVATAGVTLAAGGGSWSSLSDRNSKENLAELDGVALLAGLARIPILTWSYRTQNPSIRHIGPMAQDFHAVFGVGEDDKHITTVDEGGVALAAIQALYKLSLEKDKKIAELERRLEQLEQAAKLQ